MEYPAVIYHLTVDLTVSQIKVGGKALIAVEHKIALPVLIVFHKGQSGLVVGVEDKSRCVYIVFSELLLQEKAEHIPAGLPDKACL